MKKYYFLLVIVLFQMNGFANPNNPNENPPFSKTVDCATLQLTSGAATSNQYVCINTAIANITYVIGNGATSATATGLPPGLTSALSGNVFTISGSPNTPGPFNYTVTTVGGECATTLVGNITVNPNSTIALSSAPPTTSQSVCINQPINNIVYTVGGSATGATVTGLPTGITGTFAGGNFTISGAPTAAGPFSYTVTTYGPCSATSLSGTITVSPEATVSLSSPAGTSNQNVCINTPITNIVYTVGNSATGATISSGGFPPGVTGTFVGGTYTVSGVPTSPGLFNYMITTSGGCSSASLIGTITVNPNANLLLTSAAATTNQTVCVNTPIVNIEYFAGNGATGSTVTGLPAGIVGAFNVATGVMTIFGSPTTTGVYNYMVTTTGGCASASLGGTITVVSSSSLTLTSPTATTNQIVCDGSPILPITYSAAGVTGVSVTALPAGVTWNFAAGVLTITGTPTVGGVFNYTVTTSGGCSAATSGGTITSLPSTPLSIACAPMSDSITFTWNAASVATGYALSYVTPGGNMVNVNLGLQYAYMVANLLPEQTVTFTVSPIGNDTCASPSTTTCTALTLANEEFEESAFRMYPNPVNDLLYIDSASIIRNVTIYNMIGQMVLDRTVNESKTTIDCSGFQKGIYMVQLIGDGKTKTLRIIKE